MSQPVTQIVIPPMTVSAVTVLFVADPLEARFTGPAVPQVETHAFSVPLAGIPGVSLGTPVDLIGEGPEGLGIVTLKLSSCAM